MGHLGLSRETFTLLYFLLILKDIGKDLFRFHVKSDESLQVNCDITLRDGETERVAHKVTERKKELRHRKRRVVEGEKNNGERRQGRKARNGMNGKR